MALSKSQQNFVDITINHPKIKRAISSKYEYEFKEVLKSIGQEGVDWFHQHAYYDEEGGIVAVPDFVFPDDELIIELDGVSHRDKKQIKLDIKRDRVFACNGFNVIRIKVPLDNDKKAYWKVYIEELLKIIKEERLKSKSKVKKKRLFTKDQFEKEFKRILKEYEI